MGKKAKQPEKPSTAWLGTYGDMITLMLCFFVMLYNPSEVDVTQMATITQSLQMQETETWQRVRQGNRHMAGSQTRNRHIAGSQIRDRIR